jgi:hypothetical protein
MHYITGVKHTGGYTLELEFEDGSIRSVDLERHLDGEVFDPLKDPSQFQTAHLNSDIDTVVWGNGADMSPDFLYEISSPIIEGALPKVAEDHAPYGSSSE